MGQCVSDHRWLFSNVYRLNVWGGSGTGSEPSSTAPYRRLLARLLAGPAIQSVVDLGCGDWRFSSTVDWSGVNYLGIDVVPWLVRRIRARYASDQIRFRCMDLQRRSPPEADLYLVKDLLQHWTGPEIVRFLNRMRGRRMLITNTTTAEPYRELSAAGDYRPLDIRKPPFCAQARELLRYKAGPFDRKLVLLL